MPKQERRLKPFEDAVNKVMTEKIREKEIEIDRLVEEGESVEDLHLAIIEVNSYISLLCGNDEDLYQEWKYRLFRLPSGKYSAIQGEEIETDYEPDSFVPPDDE